MSLSAYANVVKSLAPGLYWPLNSASGATDGSGNGRDGTGGGGITIGGHSATYPPILGETSCTDFDGSDDRIVAPVGLATYEAEVLVLNPFLYWTLDNATLAADQSGNGNNGTAAGGVTIGGSAATPFTGQTTTNFDGTDDRVVINDTTGFYTQSTTRTFTGWALRDTTAGTNHSLWGLDATDLHDSTLYIISDSNEVRFMIASGLYDPVIWADAWPAVGTWVHWALVFEGGVKASLYINGDLVSTQATTAQWETSANGLHVGIAAFGVSPYDGNIAHFAVFDYGLTGGQIRELSDRGPWPFNNGRSRTWMGWAYRDASATTDSLWGGSNSGTRPLLFLSSGSQTVNFRADGGATTTTWTNAWPGNAQWVHWACAFAEESNEVSLYLNGALVSTQTHSTAYNAVTGGLRFGADVTSSNPWDGKMGHVAVFDRYLYEDQVKRIYDVAVTGWATQGWRVRNN
jgi:hypothetical protein